MNPKKHKWYDVIIAWANGIPIQYRCLAYENGDWEDLTGRPNFDHENFIWRIKPKEVIKPKEIVYRLALMESPSGQNYIAVYNENQPSFCPTKNSNFVKWITESNKYEFQ